MKRILFSPVGSTDPIAGQHDGAMLHIIRKYRPEKVYVYMSKEIGELEDKDNRYSYCLEKIQEHLGIDFEIEYIRKDDLVDVHIFDFFLAEFKTILAEICVPETEVLLNVSSGTPAMKSALQILSAMFDKLVVPIQVYTPKKEINTREDIKGDYSVDLQWEFNLDNEEDYLDRCIVSPVVNMIAETKINVIKRLVEAYDYVAAYKVAETIKEDINANALKLIEAGVARLKLDKSTCSKLCKEAGYKIYPVERSDQWHIFEHLMALKIKLDKEEYADFVRAISPLFSALMELVIKNSNLIDIDQYTYEIKRGNNIISRWKKSETIKNPVFEDVNGNKTEDSVIFTEDYCKLINKLAFNSNTKKVVNEMREVEKDIRNAAAHSIIHVTDEVIKTRTGMNAVQIFNTLRKLIEVSGINISKEAFNTYDDLNSEIKRYLNMR